MNVLTAGASQRRKLDKTRTEIEKLERELEEVAAAGFAVDESVDRVMRIVNEKLKAADVQLGYFTRPGDGPGVPEMTLGLLAALMGPAELESRLRERLTMLTPSPGLPREQREQKLAELRKKLAECEEAEELEVCALEAAGFIVDRRDADPAILLRAWDRIATTE